MKYIQEAIINNLLTDTSLQTKLGFNSPATGGVYEEFSYVLKNVKYPRVTIGINSSNPMSIEQTQAIPGKRPETIYILVNVFSSKDTSSQIEDISQSIKENLESGIITDKLRVLHCEYDSFVIKDKDPETSIWTATYRYKVVAQL